MLNLKNNRRKIFMTSTMITLGITLCSVTPGVIYGEQTKQSISRMNKEYIEVYRFEQDGKWGFINNKGEVIVNAKFDDCNRMKGGLARVKENGKWGYIDNSGKAVVEAKYEDSSDFVNGIAAFKENGKWGGINAKGEVVVEAKYDNYKF